MENRLNTLSFLIMNPSTLEALLDDDIINMGYKRQFTVHQYTQVSNNGRLVELNTMYAIDRWNRFQFSGEFDMDTFFNIELHSIF